MKYTRYNIKQKKNKKNSFLLYLIVTLFAALALGSILSFVINKSPEGKTSNETSQEQKNNEKGGAKENKETPNRSFYLMQCGVFKVKDYAEGMRKKVESYGNPFIVEEGDLYRVYFGVYTEEQWQPVANMLKEKGITTSKLTIDAFYDDLSTGELCEIIQANFEIINKASEPNVKSINTTQLKTWASSLQPLDSKMKHYKDVMELKEYINGLPEQIDKVKATEMIATTYGKLKQFKK